MSIKILFTDATVASAGGASTGSAFAGGARAKDTSPAMDDFSATADASPTVDDEVQPDVLQVAAVSPVQPA